MKALRPSPKMGSLTSKSVPVGSHSTSGREKEGKKERTGTNCCLQFASHCAHSCFSVLALW